jgi:hypothetical protein
MTATVLALAALVPAATVALAHGSHAHKSDAAGNLTARKAQLAACLSEHAVSVSAEQISKSYLNAHTGDPGVRAALQACGHVPGA